MIYLIRHAQSVANTNGRCHSHASIELTEQGHLQAEQLAKQLPQANRIFISPFLRTLQTATPILVRDQLQPETLAIEEFSYLSDLKCQNTTLEERKPWVDAYWAKADLDYKDANDAESFTEFYTRVIKFIDLLDECKGWYQTQNLMVFSHGQFLTLLKLLAPKKRSLSVELMRDFRDCMIHNPIKNTEFYIYS